MTGTIDLTEHDGRLRVFTTVGTDHHPFDRLVGWMGRWHLEHTEVATGVVQHGTAGVDPFPAGVATADLLPYEAMVAAFERADVVVSHGGPATIMDARHAGTLPIVVPRRHRHGEHVDDHQLRFSRRLAELGQVVLVERYTDLATCLDKALLDPTAYRLTTVDEASTREAVDAFATLVAELRPPRAATNGVRSRAHGVLGGVRRAVRRRSLRA